MIRARSCQATLRGLVYHFWTVLLVVAPLCASAGNFAVSPIRVALSDKQQVMSLTVTNRSDEDTTIQLEIFQWSQEEGKDNLKLTRELLATPPIFTLPSGESQIIRVGLRAAPDPVKELSYRLFIQEIPKPSVDIFQGLNVALRLSIPVFVAPQVQEAKPELDWYVFQGADTRWYLKASNTGNGHANVTNIHVKNSGLDMQLTNGGYVLPGTSKQWLLDGVPDNASVNSFDIRATVNGAIEEIEPERYGHADSP